MRWRVAALFGLAVLAAGCSSPVPEASGSKSGGKSLRVAVIPKGTTHEFWKSVEAGALEAGKELGVEVIWKGPLKEDDRDSQIKTVEDFITNKVDGIVLAPLDETALVAPVEEAMNAGIPVVIFDSGLRKDGIVSFVATDNFKGGEMAGAEMVRLLGGKGKVAMLRYQEGSASTNEREEGFLKAMEAGGLEVVVKNQYGGATVETAQKASENLLARLKSGDALTVDGIFTPNESTTYGMLRALQDAGVAGKVRFVGFDASEKLLEGLKAEHIQALVVQNPRKMGYLGVKTLVRKLRGETVESRIDTGAALVTKENLESEETKKILGTGG
jgi:ribose transport system substrate-binding protein